MQLFCVSKTKLISEPLEGGTGNECGESCETCYECPYAYIKRDGNLKKYIQLSEREKAEVRQLKLFEVA